MLLLSSNQAKLLPSKQNKRPIIGEGETQFGAILTESMEGQHLQLSEIEDQDGKIVNSGASLAFFTHLRDDNLNSVYLIELS